ncbi:MAG: N-acetyltransferase family protein [Bacteroidota bacterium]|nr:N-acetyltransferase family protein [Bacteroidota bacterium]
MEQLEFFRIKDEDLVLVKDVYDYYVLNSTATFHTEPVTLDELREFIPLKDERYQSFLIFYKHQYAGYCYFGHYKKRQAYNRTSEITLYLKPEFSQKRIGTQTLQFLEKVAIENNFKNLLGIISGDNEGSIALFRKCGYVQCAHFKNMGEKFGKLLDIVAYQKEI